VAGRGGVLFVSIGAASIETNTRPCADPREDDAHIKGEQ
jgi:hypothetical protein